MEKLEEKLREVGLIRTELTPASESETTGNLDTKTGEEIMSVLKDLNKKGKTIILVTHNNELAKLADKVIKLKDGKII